ncbi:transposase [Streptomyces atroolivaceus]|uniref:transposase n=1 Tax=Streptomyces atroolivaceus TaxID=66869 RepID=UPI00363E0A1B
MPPPTSSDPVARVLRRASRKGVLTSCLRRTARLLSRYRQATAVAARPGDLDAPGRARPATDATATAPVPERLLPKGATAGRPSVRSRRQLVDGIRFRVRTGVPWRDVPVEYGPWCLPGPRPVPPMAAERHRARLPGKARVPRRAEHPEARPVLGSRHATYGQGVAGDRCASGSRLGRTRRP